MPIIFNLSALFSFGMSKPNSRAKAFHEARFSKDIKTPKANEIVRDFFEHQSKNEKLLNKQSWTPIGPFYPDTSKDPVMFGIGRINVVRFDRFDENVIYAGAASGGLWISKDGGKSFVSPEITNILSIGISDIAINPYDNRKLLIATGDANAREFQRGYSLGIMLSTDRGVNWRIIDPLPDVDFFFIKRVLWHPSLDSAFIIASSEGLLISYDSGNSFEFLALQGQQCSDIKFDINDNSILYVTTFDLNGGAGLYEFNLKLGQIKNNITFPNVVRLEIQQTGNKLYLIGASKEKHNLGIFGFFMLEGRTFIQLSIHDVVGAQGHYNLAMYIDESSDKIYAGGLILHSIGLSDYSQIEEIDIIHKDQHHIEMNPHDSSIWVCNDGGMYRKKRGESNWEFMSQNMDISQVYRITLHPYNPKILLAGTQDNGTFRLFYDKWTQLLSGDGMKSVFSNTNPLNVLMTAEAGRIAFSNDGAQTVNRDYLTFDINERRPWTIDIKNYKDNYIFGYINIWEIVSYGESFNRLTQFYDDNLITSLIVKSDSIFFAKRNQLYMLASGQTTLLHTFEEDLPINSLEFINDMLVLTLGGYKNDSKVFILKQDSIVNITYNMINVHVNKILHDKLTGSLYLASDIGVWRLENNSDNWISFNYGIPSCIISDLEISYKTGELFASTYGRGVWKCKIHDCENQLIELNINQDTTICSNESLNIYVVNPDLNYQYVWHDGYIGHQRITNKTGEFHVSQMLSKCASVSNSFRLTHNLVPDISFVLLSRNPVCYGDTLKLQAFVRNSENAQLMWSNGSTGDILITTEAGDYHLTAINENGCVAISDTISLFVQSPLPAPKIYKNSSGLTFVSIFEPYRIEWMLNDSVVATNIDTLIPNSSGTYKLMIYSDNYCKSISNEIEINYFPKTDGIRYSIFPNPANDVVELEIYFEQETDLKIFLYDILGKSDLVYESENKLQYIRFIQNLSTISQGIYSFLVIYNGKKISIPLVKIR